MKFNLIKIFIVYYFTLKYIRKIPSFISPKVIYLMTIIPLFLVFILSLKYFLNNKQKKITIYIYIHFIIIFLFSILKIDFNSIFNISQLFFVIYYIFNCKSCKIDVKFINNLFIISIILSFIGYYLKLGNYGITPFQGYKVARSWRVSLFWGDVASTGAFALLVFIKNYYLEKKNKFNLFIIILAFYFMIFSGSKTILISLIFIFLITIVKINFNKNLIYTLLPIVFIFIIVITTIIIPQISIINQTPMFKSFLNIQNNNFQYGRFWLWKNHLQIFKNNILFGKGAFNIRELYENPLAGSESKLTYILARDGIFGIFFILFFLNLIFYSVKQKNIEAYILSSVLIFTMFFYGSYINGYNFILIIYITSIWSALNCDISY